MNTQGAAIIAAGSAYLANPNSATLSMLNTLTISGVNGGEKERIFGGKD
jgi:hypothetical protein